MRINSAILCAGILAMTGCKQEQPSDYEGTMYIQRGISIDAGACPAYTDEELAPRRIDLRRGEKCTITFTAEPTKEAK